MAEISEAAVARACELMPYAATNAEVMKVAAYIQQVSDAAKSIDAATSSIDSITRALAPFELPEPVDPLLIEAAKFAEGWAPEMVTPLAPARLERLQNMALAALKRGMELAK
jgi:hypothetical protein